MPPAAAALTDALKEYGRAIGLDLVGICTAEPFVRDRDVLREREALGYRCHFEEPDIERRCEPQQVLPGAHSLVVAGLAYVPRPAQGARDAARSSLQAAGHGAADDAETGVEPLRGWLSRYCRGLDYHRVLRERLEHLVFWLREHHPDGAGAGFAVCVDTGPPVDRSAAVRAGLGFYGKSANLITTRHGTWVFIGEILTTLPLQPDPPFAGSCGACTRCIDACPTGAITAPGVVNASRCLSYVTQMKGPIPPAFRPALGRMLFGCDICQDVCPYNLSSALLYGSHPECTPRPEVGGDTGPDLAAVMRLTKGQFRDAWQPTAAAWRGKTVLQRNAVIALGNSGDHRALPLLESALQDARPLIRAHAAWALGRLATLRRQYGDRQTVAVAAQALAAAAATEPDPDVQAEIAAASDIISAGGCLDDRT